MGVQREVVEGRKVVVYLHRPLSRLAVFSLFLVFLASK